MSNFIFNSAAAALTAATLDLSTGNYYAHLVTTAPLLTDSTVANLVVPTISGYAPTALTGLSDNSQRWTFDSFTFPRYIFAANPPVGVVICKRAGSTPAANDQVICYSDFLNSIGQVILTPVGAYLIGLSFGANGAITRALRYQYSSGSYVNGANGGFPFGLIYLLGTDNNTVSFTNPAPGKIISLSSSNTDQDKLTNRNNFLDLNEQNVAWDFGNRAVKVGDFGYFVSSADAQAVTIYGTNSLPIWNTTEIANNANWTPIATNSAAVNNTSGWKLANSNNNTFWKYLRWSSSVGSLYISEVEFYNSQIISLNQNLV